MMILEDWAVWFMPYTAPELRATRLMGKLDGQWVVTSPISSLVDGVAETQSGSKYKLGSQIAGEVLGEQVLQIYRGDYLRRMSVEELARCISDEERFR